MKKTTLEENKIYAVRAFAKWRKKINRKALLAERAKTGKKKGVFNRPTRYIQAPKVFSLSKNYDETVNCLYLLKESIKSAKALGIRRPFTFIDLANIEDLQPAAAVVLAAELDRWRRTLGVRLRPGKIQKWSPTVLAYLNDLGLFDLLAVDRKYVEKAIKEKTIGHISQVALQFVSDSRNDKEPTDRLADKLNEKVPAFRDHLDESGDMALSAALAEASLNSVQHAYCHTDTHYPIQDNRWWAAASYQNDRKSVKFFVYDQGVGISETLPKTTVGQDILKVLGKKVDAPSALSSPSNMIRYVLENRLSGTEQSNRGKGFPQIVAAAARKGGRLRVISGKGSAIFTSERGAEALPSNNRHLGGTLLEWTFELDKM